MGDKTQLLVMGFAAKYKLRDILLGVGLATMLLNMIGVFMGSAISKIIPMQYINLAAGFFFLIFALLTIGGTGGEETATCKRGSMFGIGCAFFLAELGDKTQLSAIAFSASAPEMALGVFVGATLGMMVADGLGLVVAHLLGKRIPETVMSTAAYFIFSAFGLHTLWKCFHLFLPNGGVVPLIAVASLYLVFSLLLAKRAAYNEKSCS